MRGSSDGPRDCRKRLPVLARCCTDRRLSPLLLCLLRPKFRHHRVWGRWRSPALPRSGYYLKERLELDGTRALHSTAPLAHSYPSLGFVKGLQLHHYHTHQQVTMSTHSSDKEEKGVGMLQHSTSDVHHEMSKDEQLALPPSSSITPWSMLLGLAICMGGFLFGCEGLVFRMLERVC